MASSLLALEAKFGVIPTVYGKGDAAWHVFQLMRRIRLESEQSTPQVPEIARHAHALRDLVSQWLTVCGGRGGRQQPGAH